MILRDYQKCVVEQVISSTTNDLISMPTGTGKTPVIGALADHYVNVIVVCHVNLLLFQASEKLAMFGIEHNILGDKRVIRAAAKNNFEKTGGHYISRSSKTLLVSIDTVNSYLKQDYIPFDLSKEYLVIIDEAHHFVQVNKWGKLQKLINGRLIGLTATPCRTDGRPLVTKDQSVRLGFDRIVEPKGYEGGMSRYIKEGYLSDYRMFYGKPLVSKLDREILTAEDMRNTDLVDSTLAAYDEFCEGKRTLIVYQRISMAEHDYHQWRKYRPNIRVGIIHSKKTFIENQRIIAMFRSGNIDVLMTVNMFNEGADVPEAKALIIARNIGSFVMWRQNIGRVLRPIKGETAVIVDLNGTSIIKHGMPCAEVDWMKKQEEGHLIKNIALCLDCRTFLRSVPFKVKAQGEISYCPECGSERIFFFGVSPSIFASAPPVLNYVEGEIHEMLRESRYRYMKNEEVIAKRKKEAEDIKTIYQEVSIRLPKSTINDRLTFFANSVVDVLQRKLNAFDYNCFMSLYSDQLTKISFYSSHITANFKDNKESEIMSIYSYYSQSLTYRSHREAMKEKYYTEPL